MRVAVISFILIACAAMFAMTTHSTPERTPLLVDAAART
jgi:hypothetical protein